MITGADSTNRHLLSNLQGEPEKLYEAASHLIRNGGKRLRPYMTISCCRILGGSASDAMPAASAVEMIHNFSLVHDDIMDNDEVRHGVPTTHSKFGTPLAILAGDTLFAKAYQVISRTRNAGKASELVRMLSKGCIDICEGQYLDIMMARRKKMPTQAEYIKMIRKKTAALFEVSCAMGAVCAGAGKKDVSKMAAFGRNLGIAFQITDDIIGAAGDPKITKKPVGNDIREGKKSLPIMLALKKAAGRDRDIILQCFDNPKCTKRQLQHAVGAIRRIGTEDAARRHAVRHAEKARAAISGYPKSQNLARLLDFVVERKL